MIWTLKWFKGTFKIFILGGLVFVKNKAYKSVKTLKMTKNKQSNLIACCKMFNVGFMKIYMNNGVPNLMLKGVQDKSTWNIVSQNE